MTRVFVVAETRALRLRLRARLDGPGIEVIGTGPALDAAPSDTDVVVIGDETLLVRDAGAVTEAGTRAVVALADGDGPAQALRESRLHGWAVVSREASAVELRAAVTAAAQGFTVLPAALAARLFSPRAGTPREGLEEGAEPLTPREREILELLGRGLSNRRIAEQLGISEHTAKFHVASVCAKLEASSRTEAVSRGVRRGLITL